MMHKNVKKILSFVLALSMVCSIQSVSAFAAQKNSGYITAGKYAAVSSSAQAEMYQHLKNMDTSFDLSSYSLSEQDFSDTYDQVMFDNPVLFYVRGCTYTIVGGIITKVTPKYSETKESAAPKLAELESAAAGALSCVNTAMTPTEKIVQIHNYLALTCAYDSDNANNNSIPADSYSAYGALVKHVAVCQGYSLAFKLLMDRLGITCVTVQSNTMNHMWNAVQLDGTWYHVDITWDDSLGAFGQYMTGMLLVSDMKASSGTNPHKDWYGLPQSAYSTALDGTDWKSTIAAMQLKYHANTSLITDTASYAMQVGATYVFKAKAAPGQILIAKAEDTSVAKVDFLYAQADGTYLFKITSLKAGNTPIKIYSESGNQASFQLTVGTTAYTLPKDSNYICDTTSMVVLKPGQSYHFKLTWNKTGKPQFPNVSTGSSAFRVSLTKKVGKYAIYTVTASSNATSGTQTGVYSIPKGGSASSQFYVKVA